MTDEVEMDKLMSEGITLNPPLQQWLWTTRLFFRRSIIQQKITARNTHTPFERKELGSWSPEIHHKCYGTLTGVKTAPLRFILGQKEEGTESTAPTPAECFRVGVLSRHGTCFLHRRREPLSSRCCKSDKRERQRTHPSSPAIAEELMGHCSDMLLILLRGDGGCGKGGGR